MFQYTKLDANDPNIWKNLRSSTGVVLGKNQLLLFKNCGLDVYTLDDQQKFKHKPGTGQGIVKEGIKLVVIVQENGGYREESS